MTEFTYDAYGTFLDGLLDRGYGFAGFDAPVPVTTSTGRPSAPAGWPVSRPTAA